MTRSTGDALAVAPGLEVEVATWPPLEVQHVDGWRLGFSGGFTRRANCALPLADRGEVLATLTEVESRYAAAQLPAVVRVGRESRPDGLDALLMDRGYARVAVTDVMVRDLAATGAHAVPGPDAVPAAGTVAGGSAPQPVALEVTAAPTDDWLTCWLGVKAAGTVDRALARAIVEGAPGAYVTARDADGVVGVVRAAFAGGWVGLSCLMVEPRARRRGLGRALTGAALEAARGRGAARAFLQVEVHNTGAAALYGALGFRVADRYGYLQR